MPADKAALGFKLHTGWGALVAVAGAPGNIRILLRRRLELMPPGETMPRFVYHKAAELSAVEAAGLVERAAGACQAAAHGVLEQVLKDLRSLDVRIGGAGIPTGSTTLPASLAAILGSHALIHAAEGILVQKAVMAACEGFGLVVICTRERELWSTLGGGVRKELDGLRKTLGPPWGTDQKTAAAAGMVALGTG
jgi:hypothetical protein